MSLNNNSVEFDLYKDIEDLTDANALELVYNDKEKLMSIPYMMNDGVECYILLYDCNVMGEWIDGYKGLVSHSLSENNGRKCLILRQGDKNTISIWFSDAKKFVDLYQYHRIGHFWIKGQEGWRRLVYIIGIMLEKKRHVGEEYCTKEENKLAQLIEFEPFRYWTPINPSMDEYCLGTDEGIKCFKEIVAKIDDKSLGRMVKWYEKDYYADRLTEYKIKKAAKKLAKSEKLYNYLNEEIDKASLLYPVREYSKEENDIMNKKRKEIVLDFEKMGYKGKYPTMNKGKRKVTFYEEHPFIMDKLEYEDFTFGIKAVLDYKNTHKLVERG